MLYQVEHLQVFMKRLELRDQDKSRYKGKGVTKAVKNINKIIANNIIGKEFFRY